MTQYPLLKNVFLSTTLWYTVGAGRGHCKCTVLKDGLLLREVIRVDRFRVVRSLMIRVGKCINSP